MSESSGWEGVRRQAGAGAGGVIGEGGGDADASGDGDRQSPLSPRFTPSFPIHATARISERQRGGSCSGGEEIVNSLQPQKERERGGARKEDK